MRSNLRRDVSVGDALEWALHNFGMTVWSNNSLFGIDTQLLIGWRMLRVHIEARTGITCAVENAWDEGTCRGKARWFDKSNVFIPDLLLFKMRSVLVIIVITFKRICVQLQINSCNFVTWNQKLLAAETIRLTTELGFSACICRISEYSSPTPHFGGGIQKFINPNNHLFNLCVLIVFFFSVAKCLGKWPWHSLRIVPCRR